MLQLHFLFGESLFCDLSLKEDLNDLEQLAREHLHVEDRDRYLVNLIPNEDDPHLIHVFVEDIAAYDRYVDMDTFPCWVSSDIPRRTVWINPPSIEEKLGTERCCPWNTHYTEYYQIYHANYNKNNLYTVKYWKKFENIELYYPTDLAIARHRYLLEQKEDRIHREEQEEEEQEEEEEEQEQEE